MGDCPMTVTSMVTHKGETDWTTFAASDTKLTD